MNNEPIIYFDIDFDDDKTGMKAISFVNNPATDIVWEKFNSQISSKFKKDEMARIVTGPVMLAETPILRYNDTIGKFYCKFSANSIFKMAKKYFKENKIHTVNEEHDGNRVVGNVYMIESFFVGDKVKSELYPNIPNGSWMASFFVEDEEYWNNVIMKNEFSGFSLEGNFNYKLEEEIINNIYSKIEEIINSDFSDDEKELKIKSILNL